MRRTHAAAAVLLAAGAALASFTTAPAQAEPTDAQIDDVFTKAVRDKGLRITAKEAITLAHSTCDVLARGGDVESALRHIQNATEWKKVDDISTFGSLAVQGYCPGLNPNA
jgi:hypothetical protein